MIQHFYTKFVCNSTTIEEKKCCKKAFEESLFRSNWSLEKIVVEMHAINFVITYPFQRKIRIFKSNNIPSCLFGI